MPYHKEVDTWDWDGWATTTYFGCIGGDWGNNAVGDANKVNVKRMNDPSVPRMAAAIPWPIAYSEYGTKDNWGKSVGDSFYGKTDDKSCFVIQPIKEGVTTPPKIALDAAQLRSTDSAATWTSNGKRVPGIKIIPYEGCGGNCPGVAKDGGQGDCYNDCGDNDAQGYDGIYNSSNSIWNEQSSACCFSGNMFTLNYPVLNAFQNNNNNLAKCSCPYAVDKDGNHQAGSAVCDKFVNWCSGINMHFDLGVSELASAYWGQSNAVKTGAGYVVRWKRVTCDTWQEQTQDRSLNNNYSPPYIPGDGGCDVSKWGSWSQCTKTCGGGTKSRSRSVTQEGADCPLLSSTDECNRQECDNDCELSKWSSWSACSCKCIADGNHCHITRTRTIIHAADADGKACGALEEHNDCFNVPQCPVPGPAPGPGPVPAHHCVISSWSTWGQCDRQCGGGKQTRTRHIQDCPSNTQRTDTRTCNSVPCNPLPTPAPTPVTEPSGTSMSTGEIIGLFCGCTAAFIMIYHFAVLKS